MLIVDKLRTWYPAPQVRMRSFVVYGILSLIFRTGSTVSFSISETTVDLAIPFPQNTVVSYLCLWLAAESMLPRPWVNGVYAVVQWVFMRILLAFSGKPFSRMLYSHQVPSMGVNHV